MSQSVIVMGMVLTAMPVNDYDKRITILTKERGKITAFARGSRRPSSQLLAATNPFAFGEFEVFEGRNSYNVTKANIQNYFRELVLDLDAASLAFYFAEFAEYYCQENNDEREMLKLLYQSFRALENSRYSKELVRAVFELKAITINGVMTAGVCLYALSCERRPVFLFGEKGRHLLQNLCEGSTGHVYFRFHAIYDAVYHIHTCRQIILVYRFRGSTKGTEDDYERIYGVLCAS